MNNQTETTGKGKAKAYPAPSTERTPLLASQSQQPPLHDHGEEETTTHHATHRNLRSKIAIVFLVSLSLCVCVLVLIVITAYSYVVKISHASPQNLLNRGAVIRGPDRVDVLNVTESGGVWVSVEGRVGIDAAAVVGLRNDNLISTLSSYLGRWGIRQLGHITIGFGLISVSSRYDQSSSSSLASVVGPILELPLTADHIPLDLSWLTKVSVPLLVYPTQNSSVLTHFVRHSWASGVLATDTYIEKIVVQGGKAGEFGWRQKLQFQRSDVRLSVCLEIPPLPGLPSPGRDAPLPPFAELVTLQSLDISTSPGNISLFAEATFIDPAPLNFTFTSPSIPFIVSLPTPANDSKFDGKPIPLASVHTDPFSLTHPNITVSISGTLLPVPDNASPIFSAFLAAYLEGKSNPIIVSTPLFPDLSADAIVPAPNPKPQVLRGVTIRDMRIRPTSSGSFLTSGTICVHAVLPKGMNVGLNMTRVLPDVLVFDGEPPLPDEFSSLLDVDRFELDGPALPDPLPERAFGHILPDDWLGSTAEREESEDNEGSAYMVSARFHDVPLQVLPGREKEFRTFLSKVIFSSGGAVAGLLGTVDAAVEVDGLRFRDGRETGREMEMYGLPFRGSYSRLIPTSMDDAVSNYRAGKEAFVSGMTGSNVWHVNLVLAVTLSSTALYTAIHTRFPPSKPLRFATELVVLALPALLSVTLFAERPGWLSVLILVPTCVLQWFPPRESGTPLPSSRPSSRPSSPVRTENPSQTLPVPDSPAVQIQIPPLPALTTFRAHILLLTIISILAVDFPVFPRSLAKCETFGVSLMDLGVGGFVFSQGIVSSIPILKDPSYLMSPMWGKTRSALRRSLPLLVLGVARILLVKGTEYPEHESEYGTHWNFFITLAILPVLQMLLHPLIAFMPVSLLGLLVALVHQISLSFLGLENVVLTAPRTNLIYANKEGIASVMGYLAIHLLGLSTGTVILPASPSYFRRQQNARQRKRKRRDSNASHNSSSYNMDKVFSHFRQTDKAAIELASYAFIWWSLLGLTRLSGIGTDVSRRMTNLPYVLWVAATNTTFMVGFLLLDMSYSPSTVNQSKKAQQLSKLTVPGQPSDILTAPPSPQAPQLLEAINKNGLVHFLIANVATGLVNLSFRTMYMTNSASMFILCFYTLGICSVAWVIRDRRW